MNFEKEIAKIKAVIEEQSQKKTNDDKGNIGTPKTYRYGIITGLHMAIEILEKEG
jgi:hypothetical protein